MITNTFGITITSRPPPFDRVFPVRLILTAYSLDARWEMAVGLLSGYVMSPSRLIVYPGVVTVGLKIEFGFNT